MTANTLGVARANLHAALRDESEALANARQAVKTSGSASPESARTMRAAELAHARSNAAAGALRALTAGAGEPETPADASPPVDRTQMPDC